MGKAMAAFNKHHLNWWPLTLMHSWVSPQQYIEVPEGPLRREPKTGREEWWGMMLKEAPESPRNVLPDCSSTRLTHPWWPSFHARSRAAHTSRPSHQSSSERNRGLKTVDQICRPGLARGRLLVLLGLVCWLSSPVCQRTPTHGWRPYPPYLLRSPQQQPPAAVCLDRPTACWPWQQMPSGLHAPPHLAGWAETEVDAGGTWSGEDTPLIPCRQYSSMELSSWEGFHAPSCPVFCSSFL